MAVDLKQQLDRVSVKAQIITERYLAQAKEISQLHDKLSEGEATISRMKAENEKLRLDNEYLRMVKSIASSPEEVRKAQAVIAKLVREIDRCILDLND